MTPKHWSAKLPKGACPAAMAWCRSFATPAAAWEACERGDWMIWHLVHSKFERKKTVLAVCGCVRIMLPLSSWHKWREGAIAIETSEAWACGEATLAEVMKAAAAAFHADIDTSTYGNASMAIIGVSKAIIGIADGRKGTTLVDVVTLVGMIRPKGHRKENMARCADIIRLHFPEVPKLTGLNDGRKARLAV